MKRTRIEVAQIAAVDNLSFAAWRAGRGKRTRSEVRLFFENFDDSIRHLAKAILQGRMPLGHYKHFYIHDPKKRLIHAACFVDRVFHHALINYIGPVLDRAMIASTFACRIGKGNHAAVQQVQSHIRRYPWYVKIDIDGYFAAIDHQILFDLLQRRVKGQGVSELLWSVISSYHMLLGKGLPIGSLTSQHFANYYLDGVDRYILAQKNVPAYVRYMDDMIWWCDNKQEAKISLRRVQQFIEEHRLLKVKETIQINRSQRGVRYCGYQILPGTLKLTRRRQRRYQQRRKAWEYAYQQGLIDEQKLQHAYSAVHAIIDQADSLSWRKEHLRRMPAIEM